MSEEPGYVGIFTGHRYRRARTIGNAGWKPRTARAALLAACQDVLATLDADDLLPIGPRAVGYRLLGQTIGGLVMVKDKREHPASERAGLQDFKDVEQVVNLGRRAGKIPWHWVSNARASSSNPYLLADAAAWAQDVRKLAEEAEADIIAGQPRRIEVWTEAADLMALTARIAGEYGVRCFSASGWGGPLMPREAALRWKTDDRPLTIVYLGDLDADGLQIAERNIADAVAFAEDLGLHAEVTVRRVAVTVEQVRDWEIPHEPGKTSHRNRITVPLVAQAEAIPPARLRQLLRSALEELLDMRQVKASRKQWAGERERIEAMLQELTSKDER